MSDVFALSDPWVTTESCAECYPNGATAAEAQYPMYLALNKVQQETQTADGAGLGHGSGSVESAVYSFMKWKHPEINFMSWKVDAADSVGDKRGAALFVTTVGTCSTPDQFGGYTTSACEAGDNVLQIRSENQIQVDGYSKMQVFVPSSSVTVSNVRTHSSKQYVAEPMAVNQPYYTDRQYVITDLPDFMHGLWGVKTPNEDKHSDPTDQEWLCFDISHRAIVYVLYDRRATDRPSWLKSGFKDQDIATVGHTDSGMGFLETYYATRDPGTVCLGGNDAPGVGSNYLVLVGPMHDLSQHPT
jgi:hypothetical protein